MHFIITSLMKSLLKKINRNLSTIIIINCNRYTIIFPYYKSFCLYINLIDLSDYTVNMPFKIFRYNYIMCYSNCVDTINLCMELLISVYKYKFDI